MMEFTSLLRYLKLGSPLARLGRRRRRQVWERRPHVEPLEDRCLLSATLVLDINPAGPSSDPQQLAAVNGTLFFVADDGVHGRELWQSDGTEAGTNLVRDIAAGAAGANPQNLTAVGGVLYFTADDGVHGRELWQSDGTEAGTVLVRDIAPGAAGSTLKELTAVNGTLFFVRTPNQPWPVDELWKSDGAAEGTMRVVIGAGGVDDCGCISVGSFTTLRDLTNLNGTLFYAISYFVHGPDGSDLWKSDGTVAGTVRLLGSPRVVGNLTPAGGTLFFTLTSDNFGLQDPLDAQLWKSDGTTEGTVLVKSVANSSGGIVFPPQRPEFGSLIDVGGTLFFTVFNPSAGTELWKSNGTTEGTVPVRLLVAGGTAVYQTPLATANGLLFFAGLDAANGRELWRSDGTEAGTVLVRDIAAGSVGANPQDLTAVGGVLYFTADDGVHGRELWQSDGTADGTVLAADVRSGNVGSEPRDLAGLNGSLFFSADDGIRGRELWQLAAASPVWILDDGDPGFTATADFFPYPGQGYQNDVHYAAPDSSTQVATWTFTGLTPGLYRVSATWSEHANRATNAPFSLFGETAAGEFDLGFALVNQQLAPNHFTANGATWFNLGGPYTISSTSTLVVQLLNGANGYVIADAIRLERLTTSPVQIQDDTPDDEAGFSATAGFISYPGQGFQDDVTFTPAGSGSETATWTFAVTPGIYRISVTWTAHPNRATNAPFTVVNVTPAEDLLLGTFTVNQELAPDDFLDQGTFWEDLGSGVFAVTGSQLVVQLSNLSNEYVIADAVRLERIA
jgi:ELWxxDGT repeat protein